MPGCAVSGNAMTAAVYGGGRSKDLALLLGEMHRTALSNTMSTGKVDARTLSESYDELGNRYQLPLFVLSQPTNLEPDPSGVGSSGDQILPSSYASTVPTGATSATRLDVTGDDEDDEGVTVVSLLSPHAPTTSTTPIVTASAVPTEALSASPSSSSRSAFHPFRRLFHPHRRRAHSSSKKMRRKYGGRCSSRSALLSSPSITPLSSTSAASRPFDLRMRLSTGDEYSLPVTSNQSVLEAKRRLATLIGWPPDRQRWYCGGVALRDALRIADCPPSIAPPLSFVVQVVVHSPLEPESTWAHQNRAQGKADVVGAIILLRGGFYPSVPTYYYSVFSDQNTTVSPVDYNIYASTFCAKQLISKLSNPMLSRYMAFLERAVSVPLSPADKIASHGSSFCESRTFAGDSMVHSLVRAFAVANQVATAYANLAASLEGADVRLFTAPNTAQSRLEALAIYTALLTTWAGNDETRFRKYFKESDWFRFPVIFLHFALNFTLSATNIVREGKYRRHYSWLEERENPRFCVPTDTSSCTCPRLLLVHSIAQLRRNALMASLRKEAASIHSALPPLPYTPLSIEATNPYHPNWPHQMLALLSEALCDRSVPLPSTNEQIASICHHHSDQKQEGCVPEALVQRLWKITSAQQEYAKLSSYPFLRIVEQELVKVSTKNNT
ncbi:unnamed protein product [Hydatigera taeniaeformis]|uniref:Ubiquitin-like domain-containing protein n=1 Tax=Hydatigena taeniaeformis TaxID=6205 RepID=A0A0R3X7R5_HYDTA|nr:unnamed protein product [Hydatigera taeniaeformis]